MTPNISIRTSMFYYRDHPMRIEYFIRPGNKETVLFLHGLGATKEDFLNAIEMTSLRDYAVIGFDFPGHGNSDRIEHADMDDLLEITRWFVDSLWIRSCVVVGHSMGGLIGLLYAEKFPSSVRTFVNIEGNLSGDDCGWSRHIVSLSPEDRHIEYGDSAMVLYDYAYSLVHYSEEGALIERFCNLPISKAFVYGSQSDMSPYLPQLSGRGIVLRSISTSDHHPFKQNPEEFYAFLSDFLSGVR